MDIEKITNEYNLTEIVDKGKFVKAVRGDGLTIFLDKSKDRVLRFLNEVRLTGTKEQVAVAVGLVRGMQIANSCATKYNIENLDIVKQFENILGTYERKFLNEK